MRTCKDREQTWNIKHICFSFWAFELLSFWAFQLLSFRAFQLFSFMSTIDHHCRPTTTYMNNLRAFLAPKSNNISNWRNHWIATIDCQVDTWQTIKMFTKLLKYFSYVTKEALCPMCMCAYVTFLSISLMKRFMQAIPILFHRTGLISKPTINQFLSHLMLCYREP